MATLLEKCNNIKNDKDTNLKPENLKAGITCLGVTGTLTELDTSDATATSSDIVFGKTAYVNGKKIEGLVYEVPAGASLTLEGSGAEDLSNQSKLLVTCPSEADVFFKQNSSADIVTSYDKIANAIGLTSDKLIKGNTILGIEGAAEIESASGDVKLFETIDEMQADAEVKEGDLALVYRHEIQPITVDSHFSKAVFPKTVVLPSTMTDYADLMFRAVDDSIMFECWGQLDASMFMMDCYTETGNTRIQYESSDGITYNRTRLQGDGVDGDSVDFGTEIYYAYPEMWNDAMGYFLQSESANYQGLFEYTLNIKTEYIKIPLRDGIIYKYDSTTSKMIKSWENVLYYDKMFKAADLQAMAKRIVDNEQLENNIFAFYIDPNDNLCMAASHKTDGAPYYYSNTLSNLEYDVNGNFIGCGSTRAGGPNTGADYAMDIYHIDLENKTYNFVERVNMVKKVIANGVWKMTYGIPSKTTIVKVYPNNNTMIDTDTALFCTYGSDDVSIENLNGLNKAVLDTWLYKDMYMPAQTQFTATESTVLPGIVAYGSTGVVIGDETMYHSFPLLDYLTSFGADPWNDGTVIITNKNDTSKIGEITLGEDYTAKFKNITANIWNDARSIFPIGDYYVLSRKSTPIIELYNRELTLLSSYTIPDITQVYQILRAHLEGDVVHLFIGAQDYNHVAVVDMPLEGGAVGVSVSSETWRSIESYIYTNDAWYVLLGGAFYKYSVGTQPKLLYTFRSGAYSYNDYGMCQCGNDLYALYGHCGSSSYNWVGPTYIVKLDLATDECVLYKEYSTRVQLTSNGYVATTTGVYHVTDLDTVLNTDVTSVNHTYPNTLYDPATGYFWTCGVEFFVSKTGANWTGDLLLRPNEALYKHFYGTIYPDNVTITSMDVDFTHMSEYKVSQVCAIADNSDNSMLHVYRIDVDYKNGSSVEGSSVAPLHDIIVANSYLPIE